MFGHSQIKQLLHVFFSPVVALFSYTLSSIVVISNKYGNNG